MDHLSKGYHWFVKQGATDRGASSPGAAQGGGSAGAKTEPLRASEFDVNRAIAAAISVCDTAENCEEMGVGYQIFVASFCDSDGDGWGDIKGITSKLEYLDETLNVDVLWLTPVQASSSTHGYDCYDYYSINSNFGTDADYRELVYKAHQRGMKVIMDLVVNHTSPQNEWFIKSQKGVIETVTHHDGTTSEVKYRDFYRWKNRSASRYYSTGDGWYFYSSFGDNMPELNYDCQAVRDAMTDVAMYWLGYGLDGFRMDAIKHLFMWDESVNAVNDVEGGKGDGNYNYNLTKDVEFFKEFNARLKSVYPGCFLLGEQLSGNVSDVSPFYQGMDSLFDFNTYYDLADRLDGGAQDAADAFNANAALYEEYRGDRPINSMISSNHDIPRLAYKMSGDVQKTKLYFAVTLTMPGLTWIYYGDEIGMQSAGSNDQTYRQAMKWTADYENKCTVIYDGHFDGALKSVAEQKADGSSLLSYVSALTALRDKYPTLVNGSATCSVENGMLKIVTVGGGTTVTVYHNFSDEAKTVKASGTAVFGGADIGAYGSAAFVS